MLKRFVLPWYITQNRCAERILCLKIPTQHYHDSSQEQSLWATLPRIWLQVDSCGLLDLCLCPWPGLQIKSLPLVRSRVRCGLGTDRTTVSSQEHHLSCRCTHCSSSQSEATSEWKVGLAPLFTAILRWALVCKNNSKGNRSWLIFPCSKISLVLIQDGVSQCVILDWQPQNQHHQRKLLKMQMDYQLNLRTPEIGVWGGSGGQYCAFCKPSWAN